MTRFLLACAVVLVAVAPSSAQELASIDDQALLQSYEQLLSGEGVVEPVKCLFPHVVELQARGYPTEAIARRVDERFSYNTPEGHFVINYAITGRDSVSIVDADQSGVPDYVEWTGQAMEESFAKEFVEMGFPFPTFDGSFRYRVELIDYFGFYGVTQPTTAELAGSWIGINADFESFYVRFPSLANTDPEGSVRGAIRVTAAHEFKHALQVASGWNLQMSWVELDATWMEDVVYDDVNDYYNYTRNTGSPFISPEVSLYAASYEDSTWDHFIHEHFANGEQLLRDFSARRTALPLEITQFTYLRVAEALGIDWAELWREYALYNYLTGDRAFAGLGFEEAAFFPTSTTSPVVELPFSMANGRIVDKWANHFHEFDNSNRAVSGGLRVIFEATVHGSWGLCVVFQNAVETRVVRLDHTTSPQTFDIAGVQISNYDRIGVIVGNGLTTNLAVPGDTYLLSIEADSTIVDQESFGSFKGNYSPR